MALQWELIGTTRVLFLGDAIPSPLALLSCPSLEISSYSGSNVIDSIRGASGESDLVFLAGEMGWNRLVADEIWHLLRNKLVVSFIEGLRLSELREIYPLSKVSRCRVCVDAKVERSLFIFTQDRSFSDSDLSLVNDLMGKRGEVLLVDERMLEVLSARIDASLLVLKEVTASLKESLMEGAAVYDCVLDWILFGIGAAGIDGSSIEDLMPKEEAISPESRARLREAIKKSLGYCTKRASPRL